MRLLKNLVLSGGHTASLVLILLSAPSAFGQRLSESTGINLFANNCTGCHGLVPVEHAPSEATIRSMPPEHIYEAITTGSMKQNAAKLTDAEKRLLAEFMGGRKLDSEDAGDAKHMPNACPSNPLLHDLKAPSWNGWGDLSNSRFMDAKEAGLTAGKVSRLKLKWAFGFPGATAHVLADSFCRQGFRQQQRWLCVFARCGDRMHSLVL